MPQARVTPAPRGPSVFAERLRSVRAAWPAGAWTETGAARADWNEERYLLGVFLGMFLPLTMLGLGAFWDGRPFLVGVDPRVRATGLALACLAPPVNAIALRHVLTRLTPPGRTPRRLVGAAFNAAVAVPSVGLAAVPVWRAFVASRPDSALVETTPALRLHGARDAPRSLRRRLAAAINFGGQSPAVLGAWVISCQMLPVLALAVALDAGAAVGAAGLRTARGGLAALHIINAAVCVAATELSLRRLRIDSRGRAIARALAGTALLPFPFFLLAALPWSPLPGMPLSEDRRDAHSLVVSALRAAARAGVPAALRDAGWWRIAAAPRAGRLARQRHSFLRCRVALLALDAAAVAWLLTRAGLLDPACVRARLDWLAFLMALAPVLTAACVWGLASHDPSASPDESGGAGLAAAAVLTALGGAALGALVAGGGGGTATVLLLVGLLAVCGFSLSVPAHIVVPRVRAPEPAVALAWMSVSGVLAVAGGLGVMDHTLDAALATALQPCLALAPLLGALLFRAFRSALAHSFRVRDAVATDRDPVARARLRRMALLAALPLGGLLAPLALRRWAAGSGRPA